MNEAEIRKEKKAEKIFKKTALTGGMGLGLFLLSFIVPLMYQSDTTDAMQSMFQKYGLYLILYVAAIVLTYVFQRKSIFFVDGLMRFIVLPTLLILFAIDAYDIIVG